MNNNGVLQFRLAELDWQSPTITVYLRRNAAGRWDFEVTYNMFVSVADKLINHLARQAGLKERVSEHIRQIGKGPRIHISTLKASGKNLPDRESVVRIVRQVFLPCWRQAAAKIMVFYEPGDDWLGAVLKAEKKYLKRWDMESILTAFRAILIAIGDFLLKMRKMW